MIAATRRLSGWRQPPGRQPRQHALAGGLHDVHLAIRPGELLARERVGVAAVLLRARRQPLPLLLVDEVLHGRDRAALDEVAAEVTKLGRKATVEVNDLTQAGSPAALDA